jgi:hypothetical protein
MKTSLLVHTFWVVVLCTGLSFSAPVFGQDATSDLLNKAFDLVHQAWNPQGDPPSNDDRVKFLTQALGLLKVTPDRGLKGHRARAVRDINAALAKIKTGDTEKQAVESIHDAADELRDAIAIAN